MRILMLSWRDTKNPLAGGAESFLHELAKRLVGKGHSVTLFSGSFPGAKTQQKLNGVRILRQGTQWTVHIKAYQWYKRQPRGTFDLVIDNFHALPFFTPLYVKEPIIGIIHEVTRELWFAESFFPVSIVGYLLEPLFFLPYRRKRFLVASESTKKDLANLGHPESKINVFFQSIDIRPVRKFPKKAATPLLVCLSRLSPTKRFEHAIVAMTYIKRKVPSAKLVIAGSGKPKYLGKLKRVVSKHHLQGSVKFLGYISEEEKVELLKKAWLILGTSIREGWGLAITEAGACATPAVTYDVPGFRDSVIDNQSGIRVSPEEPERLAEAAIRLIKNNTLRRKLARRALALASGRTREKTAQQLLPIIRETAMGKSKRRLHILITSWRDIKSPAAGGAEVLTHEIAKRLVRLGHEISVLAPVFPTAKHMESVDGVRLLRPSFFFATRPITYLNWPRFLVNAAATYRGQLAQRVDVVIDQVHGLPSFTPLFVKCPVILFPLEVADKIWLTEIPFPGNVLGWFIERAYLFFFRNYPFLTISPSTENDLHALGVKNVTIITPGTNPPPLPLPKKSHNPRFICLGRVTKMKRIEEALLAFREFRKEYPESTLDIVGRGTHRDELVELAKTLDLKKSVNFQGFVSEKRKYELLARSWALLSTSLREGWGLNVIEAASVGTPTIAYCVPGIVDTVRDGTTGLLTAANNPSALARKMTQLTEHGTLRRQLSENAKTFSQTFSWEKTTREFLRAVQSLIPNNAGQ